MRYKTVLILCAFLFLSASTIEKEKKITIFMIGDSTMADRSTDNGNQERGWGQMLSCFLTEDIVVENHAASGRSTLSFIHEGRWQAVHDKLKQGDYVIIQFGHNDEKPAPDLHTVPGGTFDDNLRKFVQETREKGANPILLNSIVRRNYPPTPDTKHQYTYEKEGTVLVDTHGEYINSPRRVAREMNVPFIDMAGLTRDLVLDMGPEASKKLYMWIPAGVSAYYPKGRVDNTHLSIYGSKVIADIALKEIVKQVPKLAEYARPYDGEVHVADYKGNKKCAISYTFDDGLKEHYTLVYPLLEKLGFKGTFWIIGKITEYRGADLGKPRISWNQLKEMSDKGHEISNHSWSHPVFLHKSLQLVQDEIAKGDSIIQHKTGKKPLTFCYPGNFYNDSIVEIASKGRIATRLHQQGIGGQVSKSTPEKLDRWVKDLIATGDWGVAMTHGITYGYDYFYEPEILWNHLRKVKELESEIWVDTFAKIGAYAKERKNIRLEIVKRKSGYDVTPRLNLDSHLFTEPLTMTVKNGKEKITVEQDKKSLPVQQAAGGILLFDFNPYGGTIHISF